ncbi:hypothetical protein TNCV_4836941 [Trichonephila clavipes]|nr:hypothetical protein TNCV_4836941 [Trichonephila clavipes]
MDSWSGPSFIPTNLGCVNEEMIPQCSGVIAILRLSRERGKGLGPVPVGTCIRTTLASEITACLFYHKKLESLREKERVILYEDLCTINRTKYSTFKEAADLSKSEDFMYEVLDDTASVMNLSEEERQDRIL